MQLKLSRKPTSEEEQQAPEAVSATAESAIETLNRRADLSGITGLDISSSQLAAATVSGGRVKSASYMTLDPGLVVDGEIAQPEELGAAISQFISASGLSDSVRIGVASSRVVIRSFEMPRIDDRREFEAAIRFQASDHLPMSVDEAVIDYQIVGTAPAEESGQQEKFQVVLVGASRGLIDSIIATAHHAGVKLQSIDLSAFGLIRALYPGSATAAETICYLHVGDMVNVTLAQGTICKFTRVTPTGTGAALARLRDRATLTQEHAEMWFEHVGLLAPVESISGEQDIVLAAREELQTMVDQLGNDITAAVDFHNVQAGAVPASRILLSGPVARIEGVAEALQQRTGLLVSVPAPLGALDASEVESDGVDLSRLTIAAGLALEEAAAQ
jgi:type IV pilus assembly protein PilM